MSKKFIMTIIITWTQKKKVLNTINKQKTNFYTHETSNNKIICSITSQYYYNQVVPSQYLHLESVRSSCLSSISLISMKPQSRLYFWEAFESLRSKFLDFKKFVLDGVHAVWVAYNLWISKFLLNNLEFDLLMLFN